MPEPVDCKDRRPNETLVELLKTCLREAEAGELRTAVIVCSYDDDGVDRYWSLDNRTGMYRVLGMFSTTLAELQAHVASKNYQSPFSELRGD